MNYKNATENLQCDKCQHPIRIDDPYYDAFPNYYCLSCRAKQIKNPRGKQYYNGVLLPIIGSKRWQKAFLNMLKENKNQITISKDVYHVVASMKIAAQFNAEFKPNNVEKAQLFLIDLHEQNKL